MKKILLFCMVVALTLSGLFAQAPDTAKPDTARILKELDALDNFSGKDFSSIYTIVSKKPGEKDSVTQVRMFRRDAKKQFTMLLMLPEANKGQGYIREGDNVWFYDPSSRKFAHSSVKENIQNSEAKNSDLTERSIVDDYEVLSTSEGVIGKFPVWVIELKAKTNEVSYERMKLYVRKDKTMILKEEDFSVSGRLMRTTLFPKYADLGGKLMPSQILINDELNPGEQSQLTMTEQSLEKIPDKVFQKTFLEEANK